MGEGGKGLNILYKCVNPNFCVRTCRSFVSSADPGQVPGVSKRLVYYSMPN